MRAKAHICARPYSCKKIRRENSVQKRQKRQNRNKKMSIKRPQKKSAISPDAHP
jgi:hypothetical protein